MITTSATLSSQISLSNRCSSAPGFEARADIRKDQDLCAFALCRCLTLQAFQLDVEIPFLSMSTHSTIQNNQPSIEGSYDLFDFRTRDAHLNYPIRPALFQRLTVIGCNPSSCAAWLNRNNFCSCFAFAIDLFFSSSKR